MVAPSLGERVVLKLSRCSQTDKHILSSSQLRSFQYSRERGISSRKVILL